MKSIMRSLLLFIVAGMFLTGCEDELTPLYRPQAPGKVVIRGFNALADSVQVVANGEPLKIGNLTAFKGRIVTEHKFVFFDHLPENINIVNKATGEVLRSYTFTDEQPVDTISFYAKEAIYIDEVLASPPGTLSATGRTGYKFIFPTMNRYSNSGYDGPIDVIIKKTNGEVLGVAENITKDSFGTFVEFPFGPPPVITVELVKHGTTESYVTGQPVIAQMVMQNNRSRLIVLEEKMNDNGTFGGVNATTNLVDHFDFL